MYATPKSEPATTNALAAGTPADTEPTDSLTQLDPPSDEVATRKTSAAVSSNDTANPSTPVDVTDGASAPNPTTTGDPNDHPEPPDIAFVTRNADDESRHATHTDTPSVANEKSGSPTPTTNDDDQSASGGAEIAKPISPPLWNPTTVDPSDSPTIRRALDGPASDPAPNEPTRRSPSTTPDEPPDTDTGSVLTALGELKETCSGPSPTERDPPVPSKPTSVAPTDKTTTSTATDRRTTMSPASPSNGPIPNE